MEKPMLEMTKPGSSTPVGISVFFAIACLLVFFGLVSLERVFFEGSTAF